MADPAVANYVHPVVAGMSTIELTSSNVVKNGKGYLLGFWVASTSSGTIKLWDNTAGSGTVIINTTSLTAVGWYPCPFPFSTGCFATIGGTADISFSFT